MTENDRIEVEILVKPAGAGERARADADSGGRPSPGDLERCRRWFAEKGLVSYSSDFSVVCTGQKELIEKIFQTTLTTRAGQPGKSSISAKPSPTPPAELANLIESICFPVRPEFFP